MKTTFIFLLLLTPCLIYGQNRLKQKTQKQYNSSRRLTSQIVEDYDRNGYLIKKSMLDRNGALKSYTHYTNDAQGKEIADTSFNARAEPTETYKLEYDEHQEIIKQTRTYPERGDLYMEIFENTYDTKGNLIRQKQFDKDSILDWVYLYEFNTENLMIRYYSKFNDTLRNERTYTYKNGLKTEEVLYDYENDELKRTKNELYFYEYDKNKRLIKRVVHCVALHLPREIIYVQNFTYDKEGHLILEERFEDDKFESKVEIQYIYW